MTNTDIRLTLIDVLPPDEVRDLGPEYLYLATCDLMPLLTEAQVRRVSDACEQTGDCGLRLDNWRLQVSKATQQQVWSGGGRPHLERDDAEVQRGFTTIVGLGTTAHNKLRALRPEWFTQA
jgi:hypothetical protein